MSRRTLWYTLVVAVVGLLLYSFMRAYRPARMTAPIVSEGAVPQVSPTLSIPTAFGYVKVRNFLPEHTETDGVVTVASDTDFRIVYFLQDHSFLITLLAHPLQSARTAAEKHFSAELGLDPQEACKLRVSLTVPQEVDALVGGREFGLSACPDSKPLP